MCDVIFIDGGLGVWVGDGARAWGEGSEVVRWVGLGSSLSFVWFAWSAGAMAFGAG